MPLNDLSGFPMVMSVSQDAINAQMAKQYGPDSKSNDVFLHVPWNMGPKNESWILTVEEFAVPTIDFKTTVINGCRLKMVINKGNFTTWVFKGMANGKPNMERQIIPLDGFAMYLTTPIRKIRHDHWMDETFEAQALFADLENMHDLEFGMSADKELDVLGTSESSLKTIFQKYIRNYGEANPKALLFGAIKTHPVNQTTGLLKPTGVTFSITKYKTPSGVETGCLNYLIWTKDPKDMPTDGGTFVKPLLAPGQHATFVLSEATALETIAGSLIRADQDFHNIDLGIDHGIFDVPSAAHAKLHLNGGEVGFGVVLNDRSRSAQLRSIDATIESGKIKILYVIHTSVYGAFGDIDMTVTAYRLASVVLEGDKLKVNVGPAVEVHFDADKGNLFGHFSHICEFALWKEDTIATDLLSNVNLPGCAIWNFDSVAIDSDRQMYLGATYE